MLVHETPEIKWNEQASVGVVVAAQGYPGDYVKGAVIPDFSNEETAVFYAGVAEENQTLVSQGGRVLLVEANAPTIAQAQEKVYQTLANLDTDQLFYRSDIGHKALK